MLEFNENNIYGLSSTNIKRKRQLPNSVVMELTELSEGFDDVMNRFSIVLKEIDKEYKTYQSECINEGISIEEDKIIMSEMYSLLSERDVLSESVKEKVQDLKHNVKGKEKALDKAVASKLTDVLDDIKDDIRDKHVEKIPFKLSKIIKIALASGGALAVFGPVIGAVTIITGFAVGKRISAKEKDRLISEIREEIMIVEEKIKDADGNGDKNEKYQLMRLKNSLKRSEIRIKRSI